MKYIDSDCHPNSAELRAEAEAVFYRARAAVEEKMGVIGGNLADSAEAVEMSRRYSQFGLFPVVGVHPHEARTMPDAVAPELL
ncbi:MAG: TatD family hydrolase, partial [Pyramidobacter sp.]|nr:TatD family hydrolase [Pyramidobacter sp.]